MSESRFSSDKKTILRTLDPIHRSLLMNNSEFENKSRNCMDSSPSTPEMLHVQQLLMEQQIERDIDYRTNFYDTSHLRKPGAMPHLIKSNRLPLFREEFDMADQLEYRAPSIDKKPTVNELQSRKSIRIRITTKRRIQSCGFIPHDTVPDGRYSSRYSTDTDTESSGGKTNTDEFGDYNGSNNYGSSSNDEATTASSSCSESTAPMIKIVQKMTEQRTVVSTVQVNKKKIRNFQASREDRTTVTSTTRPKWKNNQKIIDDNICNEMLDETINWNVTKGEKPKDSFEPPPAAADTIIHRKLERKAKKPADTITNGKLERKAKKPPDTMINGKLEGKSKKPADVIIYGKLEGKAKQPADIIIHGKLEGKAKEPADTITDGKQEGKTDEPADTMIYGKLEGKRTKFHPNQGKLLQRRLARIRRANVNGPLIYAGCSMEPIHNIPPAKPPRIFVSSSSKSSSDSIGANTATTLPIDDHNIGANTATTIPIDDHKSLPCQHSLQRFPSVGWVFDNTSAEPTCPSFDDLSEHDMRIIGWLPAYKDKRDDFSNVQYMLNYDHTSASKITSSNLAAEPQFQVPCKEDIDQVDSYEPPIPKYSNRMSIDLVDSICNSTPVKRSNQFSSHSVPNSTRNEWEFCANSKSQITGPSSLRKSFGKGAIELTRRCFQASKKFLSKSKPKPKECCSESDFSVDLNDNIENKLNTTADFNTNDTVRFHKKTEKALDLTPKQSDSMNNNDGTRSIFDKRLTSMKRTPAKEPICRSLGHKDITRSPSNNEEENFDFNRIVDSPKAKERARSFRLSPRKLFCSANDQPNRIQNYSYRSFEAEQDESELECAASRWRSRVRSYSTSSAVPHQRVVKIDCHPEPEYSEIVVQPPTTTLNNASNGVYHIIVNNNPKAVYATVNKTKNRNVDTVLNVDVDKIQAETEEAVYKSWNSLSKLPINSNFADSVLNMLALIEEQNSDSHKPVLDHWKAQQNASLVATSSVVEPPVVQLTSEQFQQSAAKASDDSTSVETFYTESLCEDVIRGDSVNEHIVKDIVAGVDQLEHLVSEITLAEPETDSELDALNETMVSTGHFVELGSITDENPSTSSTVVGSTQQTKKKSVHHHTQTTDTMRIQKLRSSFPDISSMIEIPDHHMLKLTTQIVAQRAIHNQLKRAIQICRATKEFECSSELIEAERLMLLSAKKESCAKHELRRIDYESNGLTDSPAECIGTVTIKNIEFDLKPEELVDQICQFSYICVCSYRDQVVATYAQERKGNTVRFHGNSLKIGSLNSAFEIQFEIFVLRLPRPLKKFSHESKYHLNKKPKKSKSYNPLKMLTNATASTSRPILDPEESRFRLRGALTLSASHLSSEKVDIIRNDSWPTKHPYVGVDTKKLHLKVEGKPFSKLTGELRTELICEIKMSDTGLAGLLSIAEEFGTKREMWCRLVGCTIQCWSTDIDCLNGKAAILSIDLIKCTNELFELVEHKFAVNIFNTDVNQADKSQIKRYWLSANNQNDLISWLAELNRILKFIKDWNFR